MQTPLTDRCYLTLTQALEGRLGGSPFGPADTGKTESVKALGVQLGRFVLVLCCDENFDFQAMGRIYAKSEHGAVSMNLIDLKKEFCRLYHSKCRLFSLVSKLLKIIQIQKSRL